MKSFFSQTTTLKDASASLNNIDTNLGAKADAAASSDTGTFSLISLFKRLLTKVTTFVSNQTDGSQVTKITDGAGTVTTKQLGTQVTNSDVGLVTNSLIHGLSSAGGGTFVDVKVNPAGKLEVNDADVKTALADGSQKSQIVGTASTLNNSTTPLNAGFIFTGTAELNSQPDVLVSCKTDQVGKLYFDFSNDGTNWDTFPPSGFDVAANVHELHNAVKGGRYFRVRFTNTSASNQTYLRLYTYYGVFKQLNAPLNSSVSTDADSVITRSVLMGQTDSGSYQYVPVTAEGHLEVAIHSSLTPFYALHTEKYTPVFQTDGVYSINSGQILATTTLSGGVTTTDSVMVASTGITAFGSGILQSRKRLRYRAGQGSIARFTAMYTTPVANSYQLAGLGHSEDGVYLGYGNTSNLSDTSFGILYVNRGIREIKTLTLTTRATSAGNVTITLNGTAYTVALTNSSLQQNVWEISQATYAGWEAYASGATVVFLRNSSGVTAGTQTYGAGTTGSAATIVQTKAGVASTDTFIPQSSWNGDKLDGNGASGVTLNPQTLNVFEIAMQYLGAGAIVFRAEVAPSDTNNTMFVDIHTLKLPNTLTKTTFGNPSLPFTMAAYSAGSTSNLQVSCGSFAGFTEGDKKLQGNRFSYNTQAGVTANNSTLNTEFTIMNPLVYQGRSNQSVINLISISASQQHNNVTTIYLIKNGALVGAPNFIPFSNISMSLWDNAATSVTVTDGSQQVWSAQIGATGNFVIDFADEITLQPGEWISVAARSGGGGPIVYLTLNTREDQ